MDSFENLAIDTLMPITDRPPVVFTHGQGSWLWDHRERRYLDFVQGWAVNSLGHCPPAIAQALATQAARLISPSPAYFNEVSVQLASAITAHSCFDQAFFASSGAEANEGAIKLARRWGAASKRHEIITFANSFHGRTLATMSASGKAAFEPLFEPKVPGFPKAALNDIESVRRLINDKTVAVMIEPVQGEAGVLTATDAFMRELRQLTRDHNLLLIVDEVQTGVGRTGKLWGYQHAGIEPDIMTLGKGLGGGVPLSALLASQAASCFEPGDQGGTYCGNPLMAAVGLAIMKAVMVPGFLAHVEAAGAHLSAGLSALSARHGLGAPRGRGLLVALDTKHDIAPAVVQQAFTRGLLINAPRANVLRFMPALNVSVDEIDTALALLDEAVGAAREEQNGQAGRP